MALALNDRLGLIVSYINKGDSVCDVGTDHGYIPIYLAQNGISDNVIMSDISRGSLDKAINDAEEELEDAGVISARLGDGLDVLSPGECDDVVIAGMGGLMIIDILSWDAVKTSSFRRFILQPRNNCGRLREWLRKAGFTIEDQAIVTENSHYCEVICCSTDGGIKDPGSGYDTAYESDPVKMAEYDYPDDMHDVSGGTTIQQYFDSEKEKAERILDGILKNTDGSSPRAAVMRERIERLEKLCREKNS